MHKTRSFLALIAILCPRKGLETNVIWELRALPTGNLQQQFEESLSAKKEIRGASFRERERVTEIWIPLRESNGSSRFRTPSAEGCYSISSVTRIGIQPGDSRTHCALPSSTRRIQKASISPERWKLSRSLLARNGKRSKEHEIGLPAHAVDDSVPSNASN